MAVEKHTMTEEEYHEYSEMIFNMNEQLQGATLRLVTPAIIKLLVSTYLVLKGFTEDVPNASQLHDNLITEISYLIAHRTDEAMKELRERN